MFGEVNDSADCMGHVVSFWWSIHSFGLETGFRPFFATVHDG